MLNYFLAGWAAQIIFCEVYMSFTVKDSDGETSWPDDDSKALSKQHAEYSNVANMVKRRAIRVTYLVMPALAAFLTFFM